eukprot:c2306_g1_i1.p1 GENE.c2306_g1_i1~~c2306_g1_i1.p1  ORF type:complete len:203 (+),score=31.12 c2306_g1_i1:72-611(+)
MTQAQPLGQLTVQAPKVVVKPLRYTAHVSNIDLRQELQPDREKTVDVDAVDDNNKHCPDALLLRERPRLLGPEKSFPLIFAPGKKIGCPVRIRVRISDGTTMIEGISNPIFIKHQQEVQNAGNLRGPAPLKLSRLLGISASAKKSKYPPCYPVCSAREGLGRSTPKKMKAILKQPSKFC